MTTTKLSFAAGSPQLYTDDRRFVKTIELGKEFQYTPEPIVRYIDRRDVRLEKYASVESLDFIRSVDPEPGHTTVLVLAMSASDYYGANRNGDGFSSRPVYINGRKELDWGETLPEHYKSFETMAHNFVHHQNKDPRNSVGSVRKAFYNQKMQRVELLLDVNNSNVKVRTFMDKIRDGEFPAVSMGCRIKYDICDVCANRAPTRRQYCVHVNGSDPRYGLGKILGNGDSCIVWNPSPSLFDISWIFKPADRIGYALKVMSTDGENVGRDEGTYTVNTVGGGHHAMGKTASFNIGNTGLRSELLKIADIEKIVQGVIHGVRPPHDLPSMDHRSGSMIFDNVKSLRPALETQEPFSEKLINTCAQEPISVVLASLAKINMFPTLIDIYRITCKKNDVPFSAKIASSLFDARSEILKYATYNAGLLEEILAVTGLDSLDTSTVSDSVLTAAYPQREKCALLKDLLVNRAFNENQGGSTIAKIVGADNAYTSRIKPLATRDRRGNVSVTTRDVADEARLKNFKAKATGAGITAGLTGAAVIGSNYLPFGKYRSSAPVRSLSAALPVAIAAGGAYLTSRFLKSKSPEITTVTGEKIPWNTPMSSRKIAEHTEYLNPETVTTLLVAIDRFDSLALKKLDCVKTAGRLNTYETFGSTSRYTSSESIYADRDLGYVVQQLFNFIPLDL